jgi:hypothetical protein
VISLGNLRAKFYLFTILTAKSHLKINSKGLRITSSFFHPKQPSIMSRQNREPYAFDRYAYRELLESSLLLHDSDLRKSLSLFNVDHWAASRVTPGATPMKYQMDMEDGRVEMIEYECDLSYFSFESGFNRDRYVKRDSKYMTIDAMTGQWIQLSTSDVREINLGRGPGVTINCNPDKILATWIADADRCLQQAINERVNLTRSMTRLDTVAAMGTAARALVSKQENGKFEAQTDCDPVVTRERSPIAIALSAPTVSHKRKVQQDEEDVGAIEGFSRHKRHRCCREKSGCYSEHNEGDVRDHLESFDKLVKEYFELTAKAKLKGNELRQLSAKLRQGGGLTLTYRNLTDCCQARFCKTQPSGVVVYHGLRLKD